MSEDADRGDTTPADKAAPEDKAPPAKAEDKTPPEDKDVRIPKARFDEAVAKERARTEAAEKRAKALEGDAAQRQAQADVSKLRTELSDLEDKLEAKTIEGTPEERRALRTQIREKHDQITDARVEARSSYATALAVEQVTYNSVVDRMEAEYPFLSPGSEDAPNPEYNEVITGELLELKGAYEAAGHTSSSALRKATKILKGSLDAAKAALKKDDPAAEEKAEDAAEKKAAEAKAKIDAETKSKAEAAEAKRKEEATKKGTDAKDKQPPAGPGAGKEDKDMKDIEPGKISDKQFEELPEAELKRLRGDAG